MLPFLRNQCGNASSRHDFGTQARKAVDRAREQVAAIVRAQPVQVVFVSRAPGQQPFQRARQLSRLTQIVVSSVSIRA
jgi:cysteine sulfinate desulfinase/cysteine desulfurase-like protein